LSRDAGGRQRRDHCNTVASLQAKSTGRTFIGNASSPRCPQTPDTNELDSTEWAGLAGVMVAPTLIWLQLLTHRDELTNG
jgi:hypothetical protein